MRARSSSLFMSSFIAVSLLSAGAASAQMQPLNLAAGKALYNTNCAICHLGNGAGGVHFGDAVSANLQAPGLESAYHNSDKLIMRDILQPRDDDDEPLELPIPAWAGRLSVAQAKEIVAYLHSLHA